MNLKRTKQIISEKDVEHLAELARLEVSRKDVATLRVQLNEILEYFKKMDEVDTNDVPPTYHVQDLVNVLRDDVPQPSEPEKLLENAPKKKDRFIKAPKMV